MIIVNKILDLEKKDIIGIGFIINNQNYFICANQKNWPRIRAGTYPRYHDIENTKMISYPEETILKVPITDIKTTPDKYRFLFHGELIQENDQFLEEDCTTWTPVPWNFIHSLELVYIKEMGIIRREIKK